VVLIELVPIYPLLSGLRICYLLHRNKGKSKTLVIVTKRHDDRKSLRHLTHLAKDLGHDSSELIFLCNRNLGEVQHQERRRKSWRRG